MLVQLRGFEDEGLAGESKLNIFLDCVKIRTKCGNGAITQSLLESTLTFSSFCRIRRLVGVGRLSGRAAALEAHGAEFRSNEKLSLGGTERRHRR